MVEGAAFLLLSVIHLQRNGMGVHCPPFSLTCRLTVMEDGVEVDYMVLEQLPPTNLFFVDVRLLYYDCLPLFVPQPDDYCGPEPTVYGGNAGFCSPSDNPYSDWSESELLVMAAMIKKTKPSSSVGFRV